MPSQGTTIVDIVLTALTLAVLTLMGLALLWRRGRDYWARRQRSAVSALRPPLPLEYKLAAGSAELEALEASDLPLSDAYERSADAPEPPGLVERLVDARHVLILGQSGAGKTVLAHAVAVTRAGRGDLVVVCDPDARPGMWPGCLVMGEGDNFAMIESTLQMIHKEIETRRRRRANGQRAFSALTLTLSEASDIIAACPTARRLFETMLRRARKLNASLLVDVQDDQARTLDLDGATKLKQNFSVVVEAQVDARGQRVARIGAERLPMPLLPDPEILADIYAQQHPDARVRQALAEPVPSRAAPAPAPDSTPLANQVANGTPDTDAEKARTPQLSPPELVRLLAAQRTPEGGYRYSANKIAEFVGGTRADVLNEVRAVREAVTV